MSQQKEQRLFLYFGIKGNPTFKVSPEAEMIKRDDGLVCAWDMDPREIKRISVDLVSINEHDAVIIEKIVLDEIELKNLDRFGVYKLKSGGTKKTYGYMDEPGTYTFKIRFNAHSHHYLTYLVSQQIS